jgi:ribonuclease P protein component
MMGLNAFPKGERIRLRADYLRILREGKKFQTEHFLVSFRPNFMPHCRLGITVGRRVGPAVVRNRLKRRIREFFRQNKFIFPGATDCVVAAKEGAGSLSFRQMANELRGVLTER